MLIPNNKQKTKLFQCFGVSRFAYNWALGRQQENYKNGGKFISDNDLRKEFTQLKKTKEYEWLNEVSNTTMVESMRNLDKALKSFFKKKSGYPKFKTKRKSSKSFYVRHDRLYFEDNICNIEKIGKVKFKTNYNIPNCKYSNPYCSYDGQYWYLSFGIEVEENQTTLNKNLSVGIDLGIKDLAICSDRHTYKNINKTKEVKRLKKIKRRLQRKVSRKYLINKKGVCYNKTSNIIKLESQLLKLNHRLTNICHNYLHQVTTEIINRKPMFIALEDLNVKGMMKNKHLAKAIQEQSFYEFRRIITYKAEWNNIKIIEAPRFYPSSKTCSECGAIKKDLKLSDREYICSECGCVIDRDYNASVNLMRYGQSIV